jgi:hypothetical protein
MSFLTNRVIRGRTLSPGGKVLKNIQRKFEHGLSALGAIEADESPWFHSDGFFWTLNELRRPFPEKESEHSLRSLCLVAENNMTRRLRAPNALARENPLAADGSPTRVSMVKNILQRPNDVVSGHPHPLLFFKS